jgi:hypothetical protein
MFQKFAVPCGLLKIVLHKYAVMVWRKPMDGTKRALAVATGERNYLFGATQVTEHLVHLVICFNHY